MSLVSGERLLFAMVNLQIKEARRNDQVEWDPEHNLFKLMSHLILQVPNRVYYSSTDGVIGRVLFFHGEEHPYGAYFQVSERVKDDERNLDARYLELPELAALEKEIAGLRERFNLDANLTEESPVIHEVMFGGVKLGSQEYLHLSGRVGNEALEFGYHYVLDGIGVRVYDIGRLLELSLLKRSVAVSRIHSVPQIVLDYAHPFPTEYK